MENQDALFSSGEDILNFPRREPDRNDRLIPMINVVFLLLVFFMIAGTIRAADSLEIEPPETSAYGTLNRDDLILYVGNYGQIALGREPMDLPAALRQIKKSISENEDQGLQLKADKRAVASVILPILKKLSDLGLKRIQLVAVRKD